VAEEVKASEPLTRLRSLVSQVYSASKVSTTFPKAARYFYSSTTGMGDVPPNLEFFIQDFLREFKCL